MSRFLAFALVVVAGCASAENGNNGGEFDFAMPAGSDDLAIGRDDLARSATGDGGGGLPMCANGKHVVVNEVQVAGVTAGDEFIELYNPCGNDVDLTGSKLVYRAAAGTTDNPVVTLTKTIPMGGYLLIVSAVYAGGGTPDQTYAGNGKLSGTAGGIALLDASGALVDSVGYGAATNAFVEDMPAPVPPASQSIARTPSGVDSNHNQLDFALATTPTPRATN